MANLDQSKEILTKSYYKKVREKILTQVQFNDNFVYDECSWKAQNTLVQFWPCCKEGFGICLLVGHQFLKA